MGAINKTTGLYQHPRTATKVNKYSCPDCKKDVILKKGEIKVHHFAHYASENPCRYYNNPGESEIHKDAKLLLKSLLEKQKKICFTRKCITCNNNHICNINEYSENVKIINEYRFDYNNSNKSADIAFLDNNNLKYIFEICYKHKTLNENRPEPWYEINAEDLQKNMDINNNNEIINIVCIRNIKCNDCLFREKYEKEQREIKEKREKEQREIKEKYEKEKLECERKEREEKIRIRVERKKIENETEKERKKKLEQRKEKLSLERKECLDKIKMEYSIEQEVIKLKEQEKIDFMNSFTNEDKDKAYKIQKDNLDSLRNKIYSIHKCNRCKLRKCKICSEEALKEYNKLRNNLPAIEYILNNLKLLFTNV